MGYRRGNIQFLIFSQTEKECEEILDSGAYNFIGFTKTLMALYIQEEHECKS
jgi:hypothetical protein